MGDPGTSAIEKSVVAGVAGVGMGGFAWPFMMLPLRCFDTRLGDDGDTDVEESIP